MKQIANNKYRRQDGFRERRRVFVLACEGGENGTEMRYFKHISANLHIQIHPIKSGKAGNPRNLMIKISKLIKGMDGDKENTYAWIVHDKDEWLAKHLNEVKRWADEETNRGLAFSNPQFEYWLLLHFEDGKGIATPTECMRQLEKHWNGYDKKNMSKISPEKIAHAIERAKQRPNAIGADWLDNPGSTTVYKLVELILNRGSQS